MRRRVTGAAVERIAAGLSERDRAVVSDLSRLRVLTGQQLGRIHFWDLSGVHRDRTRRRVLQRLVDLQALGTLERHIGGTRAGSSGLVYALGPAGQRLAEAGGLYGAGRVRQPGTPTDRFLRHSLAVSELFVALTELDRGGVLSLTEFRAEPACWWQDSDGQWIKPDAYVRVADSEVEDSWAIEIDMATESVQTLRRKLAVYVRLANAEEPGPHGLPLPRVLVAVPDARRLLDARAIIRDLPEPANELIVAVEATQAAGLIAQVLRE